MTDDLVAFLVARLYEDEMFARGIPTLYEDAGVTCEIDEEGGLTGPGRAQRLRREVEAKRGIFRLYQQARSDYRMLADERARSIDLDKPSPTPEEYRAMDMGDAYERALVLLALPYAEHPDYRQDWRP